MLEISHRGLRFLCLVCFGAILLTASTFLAAVIPSARLVTAFAVNGAQSDPQALPDAKSAAQSQSPRTTLRPYVNAINGSAFKLVENGEGVEVIPLKTTNPVFKAFSLSSDNRRLLYTSLKRGSPSGVLLLEDLETGKVQKISSRIVLAAAISPVDDNQVAYTFAGGDDFGLETIDLLTGQRQLLVQRGVYADAIQWDDSGSGIHFYRPALNHTDELPLLKFKNDVSEYLRVDGSEELTVQAEEPPLLTDDFVPLDPKVGGRTANIAPTGFPIPRKGPDGFVQRETLRGAEDSFPFEAYSADGRHKVEGSNLFGVGQLHGSEGFSGRVTEFGSGQLVGVLRDGIVIKRLLPSETKLQYQRWDGQITELGTAVVSFNLPMLSSTMIQGGSGYTAPGSCGLTSHFQYFNYAYDFQSLTVGAHVLAAADGLVVYSFSSQVCNELDTDCPDFDANHCPGAYLGNVLIIQHSDGTYTSYSHLQTDSMQTVVGTDVCQGLFVARQGHTGATDGDFNGCGDHLHFQRQATPNYLSQSTAIDFSDTPANPLSCNVGIASGSTEKSHTISPAAQNFGIASGSGSFNITSTGCSWSVVANDSWLTVTSPASGSGNGVVNFDVADNSAGSPRTGTITAGGRIFTVNQDGGVPNQPPVTDAGSDLSVDLPAAAALNGTVTDDGLPTPPNSVTTSWSAVSGPGTVTFGNAGLIDTTADFSQAGIYVLRLTADDGLAVTTDDVTVTVNNPLGGGLMIGSIAPPPTAVNLTNEGDLDWAQWGLNTLTSFNRKASTPQQISDCSLIGSVSPLRYSDNAVSFSWSDGTPTTAGSGSTGLFVSEFGNGFGLTVPADTNEKVLRLYVSAWRTTGRLEATLSDGSASPFVDRSISSGILTGAVYGVYSIRYKAASNGQNLIIKWTSDDTIYLLGNVTLQAASLGASGPIANQAPNVNAGTDQSVTLPSVANLAGTATDDGLPLPPVLTTTWSTVSGPGTVTFGDPNALSTTASFSVDGVYVLRLTASDGVLSSTDDVTVTVNPVGSGSLSVNSATPPANVDLSSEGTADWAHWGLTGAGSFNQKSGVTPQKISNFTLLGGGATVSQATSNPTLFDWTSGTPTASASSVDEFVWVRGVGNGYQITAPADTTDRTLKLYLGLFQARGRFEAFLSDGSAPVYLDTSFESQTGPNVNRVYTLDYRAASSGQTLTVRWTVDLDYNCCGYGNVTLQAATLVEGPIPQYTLTYTAGANGTISGTTPQTVNHGADGTTVTAVPDPGYQFTGWSDGVLTASRTDLNVTANISVTANFAVATYTLTYTAGTNGTILGTTPQTVNHGADGTTVTAVPDPGYQFAGWSDGVLTASRTDLNVTANISVTANFAVATYSISGNIQKYNFPAANTNLEGVTVAVSGGSPVTTDVNGNFSIGGLPAGGTYTITPSLAGHTFDPISRTFPNLSADATAVNFTGYAGSSPRLIKINSQNVAPNSPVTVPVTIASDGTENAFSFSVSFDPTVLLNPSATVTGTDCATCSLTVNTGSPGLMGISLSKPTGETLTAGTRQIVMLTFDTASPSPYTGSLITFGDTPISLQATNINGDTLLATYSGGAVTFAVGYEASVSNRPYGHSDGIIRVSDYTQTGRFAIGLDQVNPLYNEHQRADSAPRRLVGMAE